MAAFGRAAGRVERVLYRDARAAGAAYTLTCVGSALALGALLERLARGRPPAQVVITAAATWVALGGTSLAREGSTMARLVAADELDGPTGARARLSHLCAREAEGLTAPELARATVESLAENLSDAVVAPLLWGAVAGAPGVLGYRAVNTLDAMVGYRSPRYLRFGWASARADDVANLVPARVTGLLVALAAPAVGGSVRRTLQVVRRDAGRHPSPNAGWPESGAAGALGVVLGGSNSYHGVVEQRPELGAPARAVEVADVGRAVRLGRVVSAAAAGVAVLAAARPPLRTPRGNDRRTGSITMRRSPRAGRSG